MHPYWAGHRKATPRQYMILVLSALAGFTVAGIYMWFTVSRPDEPASLARGNAVRPVEIPGFNPSNLVSCILFFATIYATGMALYRYFGDTEGYTVVKANAGQHLPVLLLVAGGAVVFVHGEKVYSGIRRGVDIFMLAIGVVLLAMSFWGLFRATVVNREFYRWFYGSSKDRSPPNP